MIAPKSYFQRRPVVWAPHPGPQLRFLRSTAREILYGGAAGGGKTDGLLIKAAQTYENPNHKGLIIRRNFKHLEEIMDRAAKIYPRFGAYYVAGKKRWVFPAGGWVRFGHCQTDKAIDTYLGQDYTTIAIDELGLMDSPDVFDMLQTRLRAVEAANIPLYMIATTNPGGPGHNWIRERWRIDDAGNGTLHKLDDGTGWREFIPARIADNPCLAATDYAKRLSALPSHIRRALRDGRWDIVAGSQYAESWKPAVHVCEPFMIPIVWKKWRGADDGFAEPAAVYWMALEPVTGRIFVYQELFARQMTAAIYAANVKELDYKEELEGILDSAAFSVHGESKIARGEQMNELGCRWKPCEKWPGSRVARCMALHERLRNLKDGYPGIVFFDRCKQAIRSIPTLPVSKNNLEDVDTNADDHAYDAITYGLQFVEKRAYTVRLTMRPEL